MTPEQELQKAAEKLADTHRSITKLSPGELKFQRHNDLAGFIFNFATSPEAGKYWEAKLSHTSSPVTSDAIKTNFVMANKYSDSFIIWLSQNQWHYHLPYGAITGHWRKHIITNKSNKFIKNKLSKLYSLFKSQPSKTNENDSKTQ